MGFDDWYDREPEGEDPGGTRCKNCGADELTWESRDGRWVLVTLGGHRHVCPDARPKPTDPLTDFKDFIT